VTILNYPNKIFRLENDAVVSIRRLGGSGDPAPAAGNERRRSIRTAGHGCAEVGVQRVLVFRIVGIREGILRTQCRRREASLRTRPRVDDRIPHGG
jgi:hypothetical protein